MYIELTKKMFELQNEFNTLVHPNWKTQDYAFHEAIIVECGELLDHIGYKWWKHQEPDKNQAIMELVDIWHFGMSLLMIQHSNVDDEHTDTTLPDIYEHINNIVIDMNENISRFEFNVMGIKRSLAQLVHRVSDHTNQFNLFYFFNMCYKAGISYLDLYKLYIGKNALNVFRQRNGYKDGTYIKNWNGKEDNEVLTEILDELNVDERSYDNVLVELQAVYTIISA